MADKSPSSPPQTLESPKPTSPQLPDPAAKAENAVPDASVGRNLGVSVPSKERSGLLGSDGDGRSFSELLAGAMASPCYGSAPELVKSPKFKEHLGMTHQQVLASFTAQSKMQLQSGRPSPSANSISQPTAVTPVTTQQRPPKLEIITSPHARQLALAEHKSPSSHVIVKTASSDGYNWRKYGQKQVKSSDNARSYYRCTTAHCSSKKKVEHSQDGLVIDVVYQGEHNHEPPQKFRYLKEKGSQVSQPSVPLKDGPTLDPPSEELSQSDNCSSKNSHNPENEMPSEKLHCSSDCEEDPGTNTEDLGEGPDPKRRLCEVPVSYSPSLFKTVREPKVVVQTAADGGPASDGYRWRKYGQKTVKGNPNPRSYYKCTHPGCLVRKHVERADGTKVFLTTYEGNHNHDLPPSRTSSDMLQSRSPNEPMKSPNSCGKSQARERKPEKGKVIGESKAEPGGEKILDSAETVVSSACKPPKPEDDKSVTTDAGKVIQRPMFGESPTAVPVKNS